MRSLSDPYTLPYPSASRRLIMSPLSNFPCISEIRASENIIVSLFGIAHRLSTSPCYLISAKTRRTFVKAAIHKFRCHELEISTTEPSVWSKIIARRGKVRIMGATQYGWANFALRHSHSFIIRFSGQATTSQYIISPTFLVHEYKRTLSSRPCSKLNVHTQPHCELRTNVLFLRIVRRLCIVSKGWYTSGRGTGYSEGTSFSSIPFS